MRVSVLLPSGQTRSFESQPFCSVADLKVQIQDNAGVPASIQCLTLDGEVLAKEEVRPLWFRSCYLETKIVVSCSRLWITGASMLPLPMSIGMRNTCGAMKQRLAVSQSLARQTVSLWVGGRELSDHQEISDVCSQGKFDVQMTLPGQFLVWVNMLDGSSLSVVAAETDSIEILKGRMQQQLAIDCQGMSVFFREIELHDNDFLRALSVTHGTILTFRDTTSLTLIADTIGKDSIRIEACLSTTIGRLTAKLRNLTANPSISCILFKGILQKPYDTMTEAGIEDGATFDFGERVISVRRNDKVTTLPVRGDMSVADLKIAVALRLELPREGLELVCGKVTLQDSQCFGTSQDVEVITPSDSYVWLEVNSHRMKINIEDANERIYQVVGQWWTHEGFYLSNGEALNPKESLGCYSLHIGSVLEAYDHDTYRLFSIATSETTTHIAVKKADSCEKLTTDVEAKCDIRSTDCYRLFAQGELLSTNNALPGNSSLQLARLSEELYTFVDKEGTILCIPFRPSDSIARVKERLQKDFSSPATALVLRYKGRIAEDELSLASFAHRKKTDFEVYRRSEFVLQVKTSTKKCTLLSVPHFEIAIADLKVLSGVPAPVSVFYRGMLMNEKHSLLDYGIQAGARLTIISAGELSELTLSAEPHDTLAFIETCGPRGFVVRCHSSDTGLALISALEACFPLPFLLVSGSAIQDTTSVIREGSIIRVFTAKDEFVTVRLADGRIVSVPLPPSASILQLKSALNLTCSLKLGWKVLSDDSDLASHGITACRTLDIVQPSHWQYTVNRPGLRPLRLALSGSPTISTQDLLELVRGEYEVDALVAYVDYSVNIKTVSPKSVIWMLTPTDVCIRAYYFEHFGIVYLRSSDSFSLLKGALANAFQMPVAGLRIVLQKERVLEADDSQPISALGLPFESRVTVAVPTDLILTVCTDETESVIVMKAREKVRQVVAMFTRSVDRVKIVHKCAVLKNRDRLDKCNIAQQARLRLLKPNESWLVLRTTGGDEFTAVLVHNKLNFSAIRTFAARQTGLSSDKLSFTWTVELNDPVVLGAFGSVKSQHFMLLSNASPQNMSFWQMLCRFGSNSMHISGSDTIGKVLDSDRRWSGARIIIDGKEAPRECQLSDYAKEIPEYEMVFLEDGIVTATFPGGDIFSLRMQAKTTVLEVKQRLASKSGIPESMQCLFFEDTELRDEVILREFGGNVAVILTTNQEMVVLRTLHNSSTACVLPLISTVCELKAEIAARMTISLSSLRLYYKEMKMRDSQTLKSHGLRSGEVILAATADWIQFHIKSPLSAAFPLFSKKTDKVSDIKLRIAKAAGLQEAQLRLFASVKIRGNKQLAAMRSQSRVLYLVLGVEASDEKAVVLLVRVSGNMRPLVVQTSDTITAVKQAAERMLQQPVLRLLHQGQDFNDSQTVQQTGLRNLSVVSFQ